MKKVFAATLVLLLFACAKEEPKLELFSGEAFAYQLDTTWELNSTIRVKGFKTVEDGDLYKGGVDYSVNLFSAEGDTLNNADFGSLEYSGENEENGELVAEVQIELDETFTPGKYNLQYIVSDLNKADADTAVVTFELN